ncbi:genomic island protein [uncultured Pseudomonas sp.]|uniref:portal protein n=1 Tax=uncultured Pseudomonas sp. TaxID=114707 RepID=UPI0025E30446|nr:genomic island protein [uncultured Pseudomonas sp.]
MHDESTELVDDESTEVEPGADAVTAAATWARYEYGRNRGHLDYCQRARLLENFYLGGGAQWDPEDVDTLREQGRPALEFNQVKPKINSALGYQIHNRMDISFKPRGGEADEALATTLSKLAMQIADANSLHWLESQVFADGLIQQRGYYDVRMSWADATQGKITVKVLDPMDVVPDPDAKGYNPDDWTDVIVTRWMSLAEIEQCYGSAARAMVEQQSYSAGDADFGDQIGDEERSKFGDRNSGEQYANGYGTDKDTKRVRVIERQFWQMSVCKVAVSLDTGDITVVEGFSDEQIAQLQNVAITQQRMKRVRWVVATHCVTLHNDWSPYKHFTIVPYFPFFRRGQTRGLVDDAIGPQQLLNKSMSQMLHVINTTANSGWITWADTINNLHDGELANRGAETGLHIEVKKDTPVEKVPRKIQPNTVPTGLDRIIDRAGNLISETTGINDGMQGISDREVSGIAIQSIQFAGQQNLAVPLDNLQHTRHLVAQRFLELIQTYYTEPRIIRITETDAMGMKSTAPLPVNMPQGDGSILNDLTLGEYDVVIDEVPMQVTFQNSQFQQVLEMLKAGAPIDPKYLIRYSNLADKQDMIKDLEAKAQQQLDPLTQAKVAVEQARVALIGAQSEKTKNDAVQSSVTSQYSALQGAGAVAMNPSIAPIADQMLHSAGFVDRDAAPIVAPSQAQPVQDLAPTNTNPLTPAHPDVGINAGIETARIEGAPAR